MKVTRTQLIKGLVGGTVAATITTVIWIVAAERRALAASRQENTPREDPAAKRLPPDPEAPRFLPNELLLTFTVPPKVAVTYADLNKLIAQVSKRFGVNLQLSRGTKLRNPYPAPLTVRVSDLTPSADLNQVRIKRAIDGINGTLKKGSPNTKLSNGITLSSAMPNWIISSSPGRWAGGPGGLPIAPAPEGNWRFEVPRTLSWPPASPAPDPAVVVAVLDTWPSGAAASAGRLEPSKFSTNKALRAFQNHWSGHGAYSSLVPPSELAAIVPPQPGDDFADHGLFVAGIIHAIAPHADIHVFHVLDDRGFTTTDRILAALDSCMDLFQCQEGSPRRVVVNMSLYLLIPPEDLDGGLYGYWTAFPNWRPTGKQQQMTAGQAASVRALHQEVQKRIIRLLNAGAVVVAAAGNDAITLGAGRHLQPRLPADYPDLICAVATSGAGDLARYTNGPNPPSEGPGVSIATWGGQGYETTLPQGTLVLGQPLSRNTEVVESDVRDAVVGLCTLPTVNAPGDNTTGWIYWAGTSFSTPIISGVAANVLARNPKLNPCALGEKAGIIAREVQQEILKAAPTTTATGCPLLPVKQYRD
ncbi:MAG: S8/S53 family peptidase [Chloroflexota bacterium]